MPGVGQAAIRVGFQHDRSGSLITMPWLFHVTGDPLAQSV